MATAKGATQGERLTAVEIELRHVCADVEEMQTEMKETHTTVIEIRELLANGLSQRIGDYLAELGKARNSRKRMALSVVGAVVTVGSLIVAVVALVVRL